MARRARTAAARSPQAELIDLAIDLDLTALAHGVPDILARAEGESAPFVVFAVGPLRAGSVGRCGRGFFRGKWVACHLGQVVDRFDDVANVMHGIVI